MKLSNLDEYVPAVLYKRGADYFEREYVEELREDAPNRWHALVSGTRDYHVSVYLTGEETILSSFCTCPFESDSLCKHEVAVCLAISEHKKDNASVAVDVLPQLKSMKKVELLEVLEDLLLRQPAVNQYLTEKFSKQNGMDEEAARRLIRKSASRASRRGFIDWERSDQAVEGALEVQEYVSTLDPMQQGEKVIRLSLIVIHECSEILEIADDSSGFIGSIINESLEVIREAMAQWPDGPDEATVDRVLELFYPHILYELEQDVTDVALVLVESTMQWIERGDYADKIYDFIEKIIASEAMQSKNYPYDEEQFRICQLSILQWQEDREAVGAFFQKYIGFPRIRKAEVEDAMEAGGFEEAIRLCIESEQLDSKLPGLVKDWKKMRFGAYERIGRIQDMTDLAYEFAVSGDKDYYEKLKGLVNAEKWPETVGSLLKDLRKQKRGSYLYVSILIDEKMAEDLLEHCRSNIGEIEMLYPHLLAEYPHEVNEIFTSHIYRSIESASNRKAYQVACGKIKTFQKALGVQAAKGLSEEIKFMYPKRKALLDELSKIQ